MPSRTERLRRLLAHGTVAALLALVAIVAYLTMAPGWRPFGVRLACTALVIVGCLRALRAVRRAIEEEPPSELDVARPAPPASERDEIYRRLRDDLVFSHRSQQYFEAILWPRLLDLAGGDLPRPREGRRTRRRGPSLPALEALIAEAEKRP
jgi:hypothetical protein